MGWSFRRSIGLGLFRINLSKKGLGLSAGVRGFRIGRDSNGRNYTHVSVPGTGIYRRDYFSKGRSLDWALVLRWVGPILLVLLLLVLYLLARA